jgi:Fe-S-cluster containining protein
MDFGMNICNTCGVCCYQTEMELSESDMVRIEQFFPGSIIRREFAVKKGDYFQLKNLDEHCIFLLPKTNTCKIYSFRPKGCLFYPMIYDLEKDQCVLDEDCPHKNLFYSNSSIFRETCKGLRNWVKKDLFQKN